MTINGNRIVVKLVMTMVILIKLCFNKINNNNKEVNK